MGTLADRLRSRIVGPARIEACQMLAQFKDPIDIIRRLNAKYDMAISQDTVREFEEKHVKEITTARTRYLSSTMQVPIANERVRLERVEELYQTCKKLGRPERKIRYSLDCIKEAREETKGPSDGMVTNIQVNQFNQLSDEELLDKRKQIEKKIYELSKKGDSSYG